MAQNINSAKKAKISTLVCDQGNGGSFCECGYDLTEDLRRWTEKILESIMKMINKEKAEPIDEELYRCPKCGAALEEGGTYVSQGGSDF